MADLLGVVLQADLLGVGLPMLLVLAGGALVIMEAMAPGAHFIVLGVALLIAGIIGLGASSVGLGFLAAPLGLGLTVLIVGAATFFAYRELDVYGGKGQDQTSDSDSLRGQRGRVTERVTETGGEVKLEDGGFNPYYQARSVEGEIEEGAEVVVEDPGGGNVLTVMAVDELGVDEIDRELARSQEGNAGADRDLETETESEPDPGQ